MSIKAASDSNRKYQEQFLRRLRSRSDFREHLRSIRQKMASGATLASCRIDLDIKSNRYWEALKAELANYVSNPQTFFMEWQLAHKQIKGLIAAEYNRTASIEDPEKRVYAGLKAAVELAKVNNDEMETFITLGLVKRMIDKDSGGDGFLNSDLQETQEKYQTMLDERILQKLELRQRAKPPRSTNVLDGPEPDGKTNPVGQITLDANYTSRQVTENSDAEGLPNGGINVLNPMVSLPSKN